MTTTRITRAQAEYRIASVRCAHAFGTLPTRPTMITIGYRSQIGRHVAKRVGGQWVPTLGQWRMPDMESARLVEDIMSAAEAREVATEKPVVAPVRPARRHTASSRRGDDGTCAKRGCTRKATMWASTAHTCETHYDDYAG